MTKLILSTLVAASVAFASSPKADADSIWKYIHETSPYWNWETINDKGALYKNDRKPHAPILSTYVNDTAYEAIKKGSSDLPYGSLIVKENYTKDMKFKMLGIKYKVKGYDKKSGDWYWVKVTPSGDVKKAGTVGGCIKCHSHARAADFIHTGHNFKYPIPSKK